MAPGGGGLDSEALAGRSISDALRLMREKGLKKESLAGRTKDHRGEDAVPQWAEKVQCSLPPPPPLPPSRTKWTRLVHPYVLIGHVGLPPTRVS